MMDLQVDCLDIVNIFAIVGCPHQTNYTRKLINQDSFSDIFDNTPVTDVATGLVFANMDIFSCTLPGRSNQARKWKVLASLRNTEIVQQSTISTPWFSPTIHEKQRSSCNRNSISLCNNSVSLQRQCQSFFPYTLLENIVHNYNLCKVCSFELSQFSLLVPVSPILYTPVEIFPEKESLEASMLPWTEAKCDMSHNVSEAVCHIVKCKTIEGFYLRRDGKCQKFNLLVIGLQMDTFPFAERERDMVMDYITYYLTHVLDITVLTVLKRPLYGLNGELQCNMLFITLLFDEDSSALEDFFYYTYRRELAVLAAQLRSVIDRITGNTSGSESSAKGEAIWKQSTRKPILNVTLADVNNWRWCEQLPKRRIWTFSVVSSSRKFHPICLCRVLNIDVSVGRNECLRSGRCHFQCYDEVTWNISNSPPLMFLSMYSYFLSYLFLLYHIH
ncbi:hypothetical protein BgiBS90_015045 [Biomphalaria glabrata]|nr:hypothetical protein BgiBS90_015045 [Biomphalaria glabrata]